MFADAISGGWVVGLIVAGVLGLLCLLYFLGAIAYAVFEDRFVGLINAGMALLCGAIVFGAWLWGSWPLAYEYHHWVDVEGNISQVSSRLITKDEDISQRFVVVINGQPYGVDDTRAALLKVGDHVTLRCKKEYDFGTAREAQGWGCKWNGVGAK